MLVRRTHDIAVAAREARLRRKLTQAQLAHRLEIDRHWVRRFEAGEPGVGLGLVLRVLHELGLMIRLEMPENEAKIVKSKPPISIDEIVDD
jgi:transcriptional regulator with XRE-family HTH domain